MTETTATRDARDEREEVGRLVKAAAATMKGDVDAAIATLATAYGLARAAGDADDAAFVAEELARAWTRRKSPARSLHFARLAARLAPEQRTSWTTLAKTCELVAARTSQGSKSRRAAALYRATARAFKRASSLTTDPEDKRWLLELAQDAARQVAP